MPSSNDLSQKLKKITKIYKYFWVMLCLNCCSYFPWEYPHMLGASFGLLQWLLQIKMFRFTQFSRIKDGSKHVANPPLTQMKYVLWSISKQAIYRPVFLSADQTLNTLEPECSSKWRKYFLLKQHFYIAYVSSALSVAFFFLHKDKKKNDKSVSCLS